MGTSVYKIVPRRVLIEVVVAYLIVVVASFYASYRVQVLAHRNSDAIQQIQQARRENTAKFAATDVRICKQSLGLLHALVATSDGRLGRPGTPGYAYYRDHPDELRAAHASNKVILSRTAAAHCASLPSKTATP